MATKRSGEKRHQPDRQVRSVQKPYLRNLWPAKARQRAMSWDNRMSPTAIDATKTKTRRDIFASRIDCRLPQSVLSSGSASFARTASHYARLLNRGVLCLGYAFAHELFGIPFLVKTEKDGTSHSNHQDTCGRPEGRAKLLNRSCQQLTAVSAGVGCEAAQAVWAFWRALGR